MTLLLWIPLLIAQAGAEVPPPTVAHEVLLAEQPLGFGLAGWGLLDEIIVEARDALPLRDEYTMAEAVELCRAIDRLLMRRNFVYTHGDVLAEALTPRPLPEAIRAALAEHEPNELVGDSLERLDLPAEVKEFLAANADRVEHIAAHADEPFHFADCDHLTYIYLALGRSVDLPISAVVAPAHMFIRWTSDEGYFNWETTTAQVFDNDVYRRRFDIPDQQIRDGLYLRSLATPDELRSQFYASIASAFSVRNDLDRAEAFYRRAIEFNPRNIDALYSLASIYYRAKRYDQAVAMCDRAIELSDLCRYAWQNRGMAHLRMGEPEAAIDDFTRLVEIAPDDPAGWWKRADARASAGDMRGALEDHSRAIRAEPNRAESYYRRGVALGHVRRFDLAERDLSRCIQIDPSHGRALHTRAMARYALGDVEGAWEDIRAARELGMQFPPAFVEAVQQRLGATTQPAD